MRMLVTSDLHYNIARSRGPTQAVAAEICRHGGDLLVLAGDSAAADLRVLEDLFELFSDYPGRILLTAGNHELWTGGEQDSLHRYEVELAQCCRRHNVHYLDERPFVSGGIAVVGNVGWYDFSFRPALMGIPLRFYRHKVAPGAAVRFEKHRHLVAEADDLPPGADEVTTRWMDGEHVKLPISDLAFTRLLAEKLRRHLDEVHAAAERVVACLHHLPFAELLPHSVIPNWEFATGFLGAEVFGETLLDFPKVSHVFCGHSHRLRRCRKQHLTCASVGSTYQEKRYEVLDL